MDGVFQFRMNNITTDGRLDFTKQRRVPKSTRNLDSFLVEPGDVLFNATNSPELVGKSAFFPGLDEPAAFSNHFLRLRPDTKQLDGRFLARWLTLQFQQKRFEGMCRQWVNQATVGRDSLLSLQIPLPPLAEQRRIAAILDQADALRAKRRAALAQLDTLAQSIFLEMFGDPATNPKKWDVRPFADLFAAPPIFGTMIPPSADGGAWLSLRVANIQDWQLDLSDQKFVDLPAKTIGRHAVQDGDLLMARAIASQEHLGKAVVANPDGRKWAFDSHLMRLRFDPAEAQPDVIRHLLMSRGGRSLFLKAARRTAVQFNINTKEMAALQIPVPPLVLQHDFTCRVSAVEKLKTAHRVSLAKLDELFASLQHRAFRGEL